MKILGITDENYMEKMKNYFSVDKYTIVFIEETKDISQLDGILISIEEKEDITNAMRWLLTNQNDYHKLTWVYSAISIETEQDIFIDLGAIDVVFGKKNFTALTKKMQNALMYSQEKSENQVHNDTSYLFNDLNQVLIVSEKEYSLTKNEYLLFYNLYKHIGECLTYEELSTSLWSTADQRSRIRLANTIFHIRQKIKGNELFRIKTIRSKGYILTKKDRYNG